MATPRIQRPQEAAASPVEPFSGGATTPSEELTRLIQTQKDISFYDPTKETDEGGLGILIAHWAEWDGERIIQAFLAALEDANFHTFWGIVKEAWDREKTKFIVQS